MTFFVHRHRRRRAVRIWFTCVFPVALGLTPADMANAGAFYLPQTSAGAVGRAFTGAAALANDASTAFTNPAGMTHLDRSQIAVGGSLLILDLKLENEGSTASSMGTPFAVTGNDGGSPIDTSVVPHVYVAHEVKPDRLWLGLGVTTPFGIAVKYDDDWFGRYDSVENELVTVNVSPSIALRVNDVLSIGGGVNVEYADAKLTSALWNTIAPPLPALDGFTRLSGDDWAVGFNAGLLIEPSDTTRLGLHYRSRMNHHIKGEAQVSGLSPLVPALSALNGEVGARTDINLPDILTVGIVHEPPTIPGLRLLGEFQWFNWSRFDVLKIEFDDNRPVQARMENYRDSFVVAMGAEYEVTDALTLRTGFRYDETPTRDEFRNTSVPDATTYWASIGLTYQPFESVRLDLAYAHTFFEDLDIDLTRSFLAGPLAGDVRIRAGGKNRGETLALTLKYDF